MLGRKTSTRRKLAGAAILGSLVALPAGLVAAPAMAAPVAHTGWNHDHGWDRDCDHTGNFRWNPGRGHNEWNDCDFGRGYWEWHGFRDGHWDWSWHHGR
ncbi:hypothetical protein AB0C34_00785 [Nocardia sp. NPDC049220]|uniref:hypothetical protein n=1 Tax=Nocardia sp. NPDC049220 TaxID=3155273 RepID=UPI0033FD78B0